MLLISAALLIHCVSITDGKMIGYWTFEEGEGQWAYSAPLVAKPLALRLGTSDTTWQDPEWSTEGYKGRCLHFASFDGNPDGNLDLLRPQSNADVNDFNTESFTIEAWIKLDAIPENTFDFYNPYTIFSFGGKDAQGANKDAYFLRITRNTDGTGILNGYYYAADDTGKSTLHSASLVPGQWYHVAYAHENGQISIWVNGVEESFTSVSVPRTDLAVNGDSLVVGAMWSNRNRGFNGSIDELRVSNTKLATSELLINTETEKKTLAWWRFEEQVGQLARSEPGTSGLNLRLGTSDSNWQDCDWIAEGISGGGIMAYSDVDTATIGYLTTDAICESLVPQVMTDSFTIEAWINPEYIPLVDGFGNPVFGSYDPFSIVDIKEGLTTAPDGYRGDPSLFCLLRFMPNETGLAGRLEAAWYDVNTERTILHNTTDIPPQQWTHVAFAFDGTTAVNNATLFVNGVPTTWSIPRAPRRDQVLPKVTVGAMYSGTGTTYRRGFWGKIDEVRITNRALTADELLLPGNPHGLNAVYLKGDLNRDLYVDMEDILILVENWLTR